MSAFLDRHMHWVLIGFLVALAVGTFGLTSTMYEDHVHQNDPYVTTLVSDIDGCRVYKLSHPVDLDHFFTTCEGKTTTVIPYVCGRSICHRTEEIQTKVKTK